MLQNRRVTWPVLVVLLLFLAIAAYLVVRANEETLEPGAGAAVGALDEQAFEAPDAAVPGAWRHHTWAAPAAAPETADGPTIPAGTPAAYDPQLAAMERSFRVREDGGAAMPFPPSELTATVVELEGTLPIEVGAQCAVRILPVRTEAFNCVARVICADHLLYPNPTQSAGYLPCEVEDGRAVRALDTGHSALDGDPLLRFDVPAGTVTVEDRGDRVTPFRVSLRIVPPGT